MKEPPEDEADKEKIAAKPEEDKEFDVATCYFSKSDIDKQIKDAGLAPIPKPENVDEIGSPPSRQFEGDKAGPTEDDYQKGRAPRPEKEKDEEIAP